MGASILHADLDAFYAAVEQRDKPELRGKPVVVGGLAHERGVVTTASYEARPFGVHSAMPLRTAYRLCPHAVFVPPRHAVYGEVSQRVMAILESFTPLVEPLSLDEAFLDVTGCERAYGSPEAIGREIRRLVWERERLTISVGVAANKSVAKIASDLCKPDGLLCVPHGTEREFLAPLPVNRLWGVGPKSLARLQAMGIETIGDLAAMDPESPGSAFGEGGRRLHALANGVDPRPVEPEREAKSVGAETTFQEDTGDPEVLRAYLLGLAEKVARRLRAEGLRGRSVAVKLRYADFRTITRSRRLGAYVDSEPLIFKMAWELFSRAFDAGDRFRLVGVHVADFEPRQTEQLSLGLELDTRSRRLDAAVDGIAARFGAASVTRGRLAKGDREGGPQNGGLSGGAGGPPAGG